jgi:hypothetical protein
MFEMEKLMIKKLSAIPLPPFIKGVRKYESNICIKNINLPLFKRGWPAKPVGGF